MYDTVETVFKIAEACTYMRLSRATVYALARSGKLSHVRVGKCVRFRREDLDKYISDRITRGEDVQ